MGDASASPRDALVKRRCGAGAGMRRVAEIVMVLAAAGEVRGGRDPTPAERALAAEAWERLAAAVAEGAARPRDLFPGEVVRAVVEDLGLNRAKDPAAMGFRPPKASISDRLMLTKRKMEEVKESLAQPTTNTPQTTASSVTAEIQGLHGAPMFSVGAPRNPPVVAALSTTAPATSTSVIVLKQRGSSPVKPVTNSSVVVLPHTGQPHPKYDKGVNGPFNLTRATAGQLNKSFHDTSARSNQNTISSTNQVVKNQATKVPTIQAVGNTAMGHHATPGTPSIFANHNVIAKNVQHVLHHPANHPSWTPPSTEYMHSRLDCQVCKIAILDASSLLVCDACERGAHLKCLQHYGNKGVPIADWHCPTCVAHSKGKQLPPKYGKVTRTVVASQAPPCGGIQFSVQGAAENMVVKENHQKLAAGNPISLKSMQDSTILALNDGTAGSQSTAVFRPSEGNANTAEIFSNEKEGNEQPSSSTGRHNVRSPCELESSELGSGSSSGAYSGKSPNEKVSSGFSMQSVDSENDTMYGHQSTVTSGEIRSNKPFAVAADAKIRSEAQSEAAVNWDVEMVDNGWGVMDQIINSGPEKKFRFDATCEPDTMKGVITANTETPIDQGSNVVAEDTVHPEANSEPHTTKDVEMTTITGILICQSSNVAVEEKFLTDTISEPHAIKEMQMTVNTVMPMDENSNIVTEDKPWSNPTSAVKDVEMITNAGIPICQSSNVAAEENLQADTTSEPHATKEMEITVNTVMPMDKKSNIVTEGEAWSDPMSAVKDVKMTTNAGIPTDEIQLQNELTENGVREPENT